MSVNLLQDFLSRLNTAARAAADYAEQERLMSWVRQACIEFPMVNSFLAQDPGVLLQWLNIASPSFYQQYITNGCGEQAACEVVRRLQERL